MESIGLDPAAYGTHSLRRTKPTLIYRRTKNLRPVQLLLGHTKLESTVRYLGIEVDDALEIAEQTLACGAQFALLAYDDWTTCRRRGASVMDRRTFVSGVAGGLVVWPLAAHAQRQGLPVIGYLANASAAGFTNYVDAFRRGLGEMGYVERQNVAIEYRWTEGQRDRLPGLARDLADRQVAVIVATGGGAPALAAKAATTSIPIVFTGGTDPVRSGLVASLGHPGGSATGVLNADTALKAKRLAFLHEVVPAVTLIAVLINPASTDAQEMSEIQEAARTLGQRIAVVEARNEGDLDHVFSTIMRMHAGALFVTGDPLFTGARTQLTALAAKYAIPASYSFRDLAVAGGLMSYGVNLPDVHRQAGVYTGRILKGAKPADLPVLQPTKFDLVINMKTAKALGITIPQSVLLRADEVIQ